MCVREYREPGVRYKRFDWGRVRIAKYPHTTNADLVHNESGCRSSWYGGTPSEAIRNCRLELGFIFKKLRERGISKGEHAEETRRLIEYNFQM